MVLSRGVEREFRLLTTLLASGTRDEALSTWSESGGSRRWAFGEGSTWRSGIDVASALVRLRYPRPSTMNAPIFASITRALGRAAAGRHAQPRSERRPGDGGSRLWGGR